MIQRKLKVCRECGKECYYFRTGYCQQCSNKQVKPIKKVRKSSGELEVFKIIWSERPHNCEVCGTYLPDFDVWQFPHLLGKGAYPKFRLLKENIRIMCKQHHTQYDNGSVENDPKFEKILELKQKLKQKYYGVCD